MSVVDPIGDMLTRIRNGHKAKLVSVKAPHSAMRMRVLEVLKNEGYIRDFSVNQIRKNISEIKIELKYNLADPAIKRIERVSKPGRRVYSEIGDLPKYYNGLGIIILSTSKGVMSDHQARLAEVGGEVLCKVF